MMLSSLIGITLYYVHKHNIQAQLNTVLVRLNKINKTAMHERACVRQGVGWGSRSYLTFPISLRF